MSSKGSAEAVLLVWRTGDCLKMLRMLAVAAVLTRTHQTGNMRGRRGRAAQTVSVRKREERGGWESQDQLYMGRTQLVASTSRVTPGVQMYSSTELTSRCLCLVSIDSGFLVAASRTASISAR